MSVSETSFTVRCDIHTTDEIDNILAKEIGVIVYDSDLSVFKRCNGVAWLEFGGGTITAINGLTIDVLEVKFGGALTENTQIDLEGFDLLARGIGQIDYQVELPSGPTASLQACDDVLNAGIEGAGAFYSAGSGPTDVQATFFVGDNSSVSVFDVSTASFVGADATVPKVQSTGGIVVSSGLASLTYETVSVGTGDSTILIKATSAGATNAKITLITDDGTTTGAIQVDHLGLTIGVAGYKLGFNSSSDGQVLVSSSGVFNPADTVTVTADTGTVIDMANNRSGTISNASSANANTAFTLANLVVGGKNRVLINNGTGAPTITGSTLYANSEAFANGVDFYMEVDHDGATTRHRFIEL